MPFERSLLELAKIHDNKIGLWLTTIESEVMSTLKDSLAATAGVSPDAGAAAAAQQMEKFFKNLETASEKSEGRRLSRN
jgi:hypothetical protein